MWLWVSWSGIATARMTFASYFLAVPPFLLCTYSSPPEYGFGWYNARYAYYSEQNATASINQIHNIVQLYWPDWNGSPSEPPSAAPSPIPSESPSAAPSKTPTPSQFPSESPSAKPSSEPSPAPLMSPSAVASPSPAVPSELPSGAPSPSPMVSTCARQKETCSSDADCCSNKCVGNGTCRDVRLLMRARELQPPITPPGLAIAVERAKWEKARGLWKLLGTQDYDFELERLLYYGPKEFKGPFLVEVRSNQVVRVVEKATGLPVDDLEVSLTIPIIDVMLEKIGEALDRSLQAGEVLATYNPVLGFPERFYVEEEVNAEYDERAYPVDSFVTYFAPASS